jgi:hypothetical protein
VLALGFGLWGWRASGSGRPPESHKAACAAAKNTRPIGDVRLGERVLGENPELAGSACIEQEPDPATWRHVALRMQKADGSPLQIALLRPAAWFDAHRARVGSRIHLELAEMGIAGPAEILSIGPCPAIGRGAGHVVTGTIRSVAREILSLTIEGEKQPLEPTPNHPFWSVDRRKFVAAGELSIGERIAAQDGTERRIVDKESRIGREEVCNLEINGQHVYRVGLLGVLVHNTCGTSAKEEDPIEKHHSDPKYMGGDPNQTCTDMLRSQHRQLTKDMNDFMRQEVNEAGQHMRPQRGNSGKVIQGRFSLAERLNALRDFYQANQHIYPDAAADFFNQHPDLW